MKEVVQISSKARECHMGGLSPNRIQSRKRNSDYCSKKSRRFVVTVAVLLRMGLD